MMFATVNRGDIVPPMTTTHTAETTSWTYAYDGSGIELRFVCEVIDSEGDFATIKITNPSDEVRSALKFYPRHFPQHYFEQVDDVTFLLTVSARDITTAHYGKVASFNWLD